MEKFDFKKEYKDLYLPKAVPMIVDVPEMKFIMIDGKGNPNSLEGEYQNALSVLYGLCFTIKMSKKSGFLIQDYFEYVIPPLEGLWWMEDQGFDGKCITNKDKFYFTSMIRQPGFVTEEIFIWAKEALMKKKPELNLELARLVTYEEGKCAQILHIGSYDSEPETIEILESYITNYGFQNDISENRKHHEIYLNDPRKTPSEKLKTVIRHPIR